MKKILSAIFAALITLIPTATFALDYQVPEVKDVPSYSEILKNIKEREKGTQQYGHDGKETQDCAQALLEYPKYKYLITDYDLTINIAENNRYKVTEEYDVCFAENGSHGIFRDIPTSKDFWRENGDVTKNVKMQVTNVNVSGDDYEKTRENSNIHLKIGNANRTLRRGDSKHYVITYDYNFGPDNLDDVDEFYYNIIGSEWANDVIFLNTDFEINFPKDIKEDKIGFTHGYTHDSLSGGAPFELKNNKSVQGHYYDAFKGGEALTIRVTLPEGYIQGAAYETNEKALKIFIAFSIIVLVPIILFFFVYGKDEKLDLYTRYDPPEGMNPVQFGSLVNANSSTNVTSLFYYLAEQGFLRIEETAKNKYDIIFVKEYDGKDEASRVLIESLKSYDKNNSGRVSISKLRDHFYTKIPKIERAAGVKELKKTVYTKSGNTYCFLSALTLVIYLLISIFFLMSDQYADEDAIIALMLFAFFVIPGSAIAIAGLRSLFKNQSKMAGIFSIAFGGLFAYIPLQVILIADIKLDSVQIMSLATVVITSFIITICAVNGKKYTEEGKKIMTDVLSYYETIKSCRPDAEHGFSYFYYTFAFAFAAGLSTAFSKRFKEVISEPPNWYSGTHGFDHFDASSFAHSMSSISSSSSSSPSSSGGGSSGGGSSGGGGGGGGGGGW